MPIHLRIAYSLQSLSAVQKSINFLPSDIVNNLVAPSMVRDDIADIVDLVREDEVVVLVFC